MARPIITTMFILMKLKTGFFASSQSHRMILSLLNARYKIM